ncbi:hypothetical protein [Paraburkholderia sediminicola]|uniref:hypothetical protein n=1 Tax=Paraburkholderia sediminicola TaxID=458836 RepID=UPI0038B7FC6D
MKKETTELTVIKRAAVALGTSEREAQLALLVAESSTIVAIKNTAGRDQCHSAAMKLRTTRVEIEKAGKAAREDATAFSKAVIAEEKRLVAITGPEEERLLGLRDVWDEAREAERREKVEAEARRVAGIRAKIDGIRAYAAIVVGQPSSVIEDTIKILVALPIDVDHFAELTGDAEFARGETLDKLRNLHEAAIKQEAEAKRLAEERAELDRQRVAFEAEQKRLAAERAEQERTERARRDAEEAERREALAKADAIMRAERETHEQRMAVERAEFQRRQDEAAAEQRRAAAELQRQQDELAVQRRAEADAAAAKLREADLAAARKALEEVQRAEDERIAHEAADTAMRNAAQPLFDACLLFVAAHEANDTDALDAAYQAAAAAICLAQPIDISLEDCPF